MRLKSINLWKGQINTLTIIDKNEGVGISIIYDEEKVLYRETLSPEDWGEY